MKAELSLRTSTWPLRFGFVTLLLACSWLVFYIQTLSEKEFHAYQDLVADSQLQKAAALKQTQIAKQKREQVVKEMTFEEGRDLLRLRLVAERSEVFIGPYEDKSEFKEMLYNVRCIVQKELFFILPDGTEVLQRNGTYHLRNGKEIKIESHVPLQAMQTVHTFEADQALYSYTRHALSADQVLMYRYQIPGKHLPKDFYQFKPIMTATAKQISLQMDGPVPKMQAEGIRAKIEGKWR